MMPYNKDEKLNKLLTIGTRSTWRRGPLSLLVADKLAGEEKRRGPRGRWKSREGAEAYSQTVKAE
jgi:hypothetical protein